MAKAIELTSKNFEKEVLESDQPVLVDFWASWCGPCQMMAPILDELAGDLKGKIKITKLNVDTEENQELANQYQILSIPNMKVFKEGKVVKELIGLKSKEVMLDELKNIIE